MLYFNMIMFFYRIYYADNEIVACIEYVIQ